MEGLSEGKKIVFVHSFVGEEALLNVGDKYNKLCVAVDA